MSWEQCEAAIARLGGLEPAIGDACGFLEAAEIENLESMVGGLPEPYRRFLREYGASAPASYWISAQSGVDSFFGRSRSKALDLLSLRLSLGEDVLPQDYLAIADDGGGNYYCLGLPGAPRPGGVYFQDRSSVGRDPVLLAESFEAFLESLRPE